MIRIILLLCLIPSLLLAQFDDTLSGAISGNSVELDAKTGANLLDGSGGSISDTENIGTWSDTSGSARHATQASAGARPVFDADGFNGIGAVQGASGDGLEFSDKTISRNLSAFSLVYAIRYATKSGTQYLSMFQTNACGNRLGVYIGDDDKINVILQNADGTDNSQYTNVTLSNATEYIIVVTADLAASTLQIWVNGVSSYTVSLTGTASTSNTNTCENPTLFQPDPYLSSVFVGRMAYFGLWQNQYLNSTNAGTMYTSLDSYLEVGAPAGGGSSRSMMGIGP